MGTLERVGLGVVGAGNISQLNVPGYLADDRCDVVAVCDPRIEQARERAAGWGVSQVYATLEELLADPAVDAVEILSPTFLHPDHVIAAAQAGKHISCQKPMANSVADCRRMIAACETAGVTFRVTENCCYYPPLERARELIRDGAIGTPTVIRIKTVVGETASEFQANLDPEGYTWRFDERSPGGHLFDDMVHKYAMASWLVDSDVTSVQAVVRKGRMFFEAPTVSLFEYEREDLLGMMEVSHAPKMFIPSDWYGADEFFEIQGTAGFVSVTRLSGNLLDLPPVIVRTEATTTAITDLDASYDVSFRRASRAFIDALVLGGQPDLSPDAAMKVLQLAFAVYQASNERRPVSPADIDGSVSPTWWPKTQEQLIDDADALGLLPDGMTAEDAKSLLRSMGPRT
jgi:predicted dehydrogenase